MLNHLSIVDDLIQNRADTNSEDKYHNTPLHYATAEGLNEVFDLLIRNKANPNSKDAYLTYNCI